MRLLYLSIADYKNIKNQSFDFSSNNGYIALIGENGSGKSNLLEALSIIYQGLLNEGRGIPFDYLIRYEIDGVIYERSKWKAQKNGVIVKESEMLYPSQFIACYSGEALRLWHTSYEEYHMRYFNKAVKDNAYLPQMIYVNKYCWEIALISLLCNTDKAAVSDFLSSCLNIHDISDVTIDFSYDEKKQESFQDHDALKWFRRVIAEGPGTVNAKTLSTMDIISSSAQIQRQAKCKTVFQYLYLLSQPRKNDVNKIDKLISGITINVNGIYFSNLSEGEKKLVLVECITNVLGDKNSLILLDEPDAHIHIARKKEVLKVIESFDGQTILTTHSPLFVDTIYKNSKDNLFFIEHGSIINSDFVNKLVSLSAGNIDYINGTIVLNSPNLLITEGPYDKRYLERAIDALSSIDPKYEQLKEITIIASGSAGNSKAFYEQVLKPQIDKYSKIVYIFDYDEGGYQGWKSVRDLNDDHCVSMFYLNDYSVVLTEKPQVTNTIMVEDFFAAESYKIKIDNARLDLKKSHKDFRCFHENMASSIKTYIENHYSSFKDEWLYGFRPILDKLLQVFGV